MAGAKNASGKPDRSRDDPRDTRALRSPVAIALFAGLALAALAADLASKHAVFADLLARPDVKQRAELLLARPGPKLPPDHVLRDLRLHRPVCYFFATSAAGARWIHAALAMILSGAVGNFYDRMISRVSIPGVAEPITRQVRDFLDFSQLRVLGLNYPYIFNVADVFLVVGVAMLMLHWWAAALREHKQKRSAQAGR